MEVGVKMTAEEFQEFMDYRADKERYERDLVRLRQVPVAIASSLRWAVEPVEGKPGRFKIMSHEHMADAWDMAEEFMPKKG